MCGGGDYGLACGSGMTSLPTAVASESSNKIESEVENRTRVTVERGFSCLEPGYGFVIQKTEYKDGQKKHEKIYLTDEECESIINEIQKIRSDKFYTR